MDSLILRTVSRFLLSVMLIFSWWVLLRGHNSPGGGFIAGLITICAFAIYLLAYGITALQKQLYFSVRTWLLFGVFCIFSSGLLPMAFGKPFLTALWSPYDYGHSFLNTPFWLDIGIYLVVWTSLLTMLISLEKQR